MKIPKALIDESRDRSYYVIQLEGESSEWLRAAFTRWGARREARKLLRLYKKTKGKQRYHEEIEA